MKHSFKALIAVAATALLVAACGGGASGTTTTGGGDVNHEEVAREFIRRVNTDITGFDLELVKINTLKYNYIVVYDHDYGTYDAYYIGGYNIGDDIATYLNNNESHFFYGLRRTNSGVFWDIVTGTRFEKDIVSSKNLSKMKALEQELKINKVASRLQAEYGLSNEKSQDAARFAYKLQHSPVGTYNVRDYDAFAKELTGSTITEFQNDAKSGNMASLSQRIALAADVTGMGPEGVNKLISTLFTGN